METPTVTDLLQNVSLFANCGDDDRAWLAAQGVEKWQQVGEYIARQGDPPAKFGVQFSGTCEWTTTVGTEEVYVLTHGANSFWGHELLLTGKDCPATGRVTETIHLLEFDADGFWRVLSRFPRILQQLVATIAERFGNVSEVNQQHAKLVSLGTMAAGLAHELNNPAAAAGRAAGSLRAVLAALQPLSVRMGAVCLSPDQQGFLTQLGTDAASRMASAPPLDALTQSDHEEAVTDWLDESDIQDGWKLAPTLVSAGVDKAGLDDLASRLPGDVLGDVLPWLCATLEASSLAAQIEQSTGRVSELVRAVKSYSFMDQGAVQEVDIHDGIESTLVMLGHKLREHKITVRREFDRAAPRLSVYGSSLNQVWTNLLDNAIDAAGDGGTITVRTAIEAGRLLVEVRDNGRGGIPDNVRARLFEPFFTTKKTGTGLGLEISHRIVVGQHKGDIRVTSEPGDTRFVVRLPLSAEIAGG